MAKTCSFCGKKLGFLDASYSIQGTDYVYCDSHLEFKVRVRNLFLDDVDADISEIVTNFKTSLRSVSEDFSYATGALICAIKNDVSEEKLKRRAVEQEAQEELIRRKTAAEEERKAAENERILAEKSKLLLLTTGSNFDGYQVEKYIDVICEEIVFKNSFWNRLDASLEDLGNALSFSEREMSGASELIANARTYVMNKFRLHATKIGANAVLGIDFESSFGSDVVRVSVSGTAVIINKVSVEYTGKD